MTTQIVQTSKTATGFCVTLAGEKKFAFVAISRYGVTVKCQRSATWDRRGLGKTHINRSQALFHYTSAEMKSLVQAAFDLVPAELNEVFAETVK